MSKTRDLGNITNVIKVDATGNVSFVSGSTTLATISTSGQMSGSLPALSSSYALSASYVTNAETLDGLDSTMFTLTSSFNTLSSSLLATSGSFNTRVTALEITGSALSSSILSVSSSAYATSGSLSAASGSFNSRVASLETYSTNLTAKTASFATTGSNTFIGSQVVSGSLTASGSITATGTITAQTLVVQTITSSVVYSSGSNVFGNDIGNSQRFTGSVLITGSLTIAGASSATSYSGVTIYGSSVACSPIGCFATSCATSFIGGTMSGTTIYGSTAVCSAVGKFTTCIDAGYLSSIISSSSNASPLILQNTAGWASSQITSISVKDASGAVGAIGWKYDGAGNVDMLFHSLYNGAYKTTSDIVMTVKGTGNVGIGTNCPLQILHISATTPTLFLSDCAATGNGGNVYITAAKSGIGYNNLTMTAYTYNLKGGGSETSYLSINSAGVACFANTICASSFLSSAQSSLNGLVVSCNVNSNCFTGITVVNSAGAGSDASRAGIAFQAYDWVQSAIWHGRNTASAFAGALVFGTNPNTSNLGVGGVCTRLTITNDGTSTFACDLCSKTLTTFGGGLNENYSSTGGGHVNRYFAVKYMNENATTAFFKITTSGASSTHIQLAGSNAGVGWHSGQIYLASNTSYWGGFIGSGTSVATTSTAAGYISSTYTDGSGNQTFCVTVANNGTSTQSLIWAYITTITYGGYSTTFTQL